MPNSHNAQRPNIMLLIGEDTGLHLGCYGNSYARTPNLDRLAAQGVRYTNALSTAPVCAPSRATIVTGRYPWSLGTLAMRSTFLNPPRLFTHRLRDLGYFVNWHTKTDFNFEPAFPPAQDPFCDAAAPWIDDLAAGKTPDQPWMLYQNFSVTHESAMWTKPLDGRWGMSKERLANMHLIHPGELHDPAKAIVPPYLPDVPEVRRAIADYFDALTIQDAQIGRALNALEKSGQADTTIVIYMTDHGRGLVREKRWCYGAGLHLPVIIRWPGHLKPGTTDDQPINWVDIAPTLTKLAGAGDADISHWFQGRAFLGESLTPRREYCFAARDRMDEAYDSVRVARDGRFHYILNRYPGLPYAQRNKYMENMDVTHVMREMRARGTLKGDAAVWMSETKPVEELYDWHNDPHMVRNLAGQPQYKNDLERIRLALDKHLAEVGDLHLLSERALIAKGLVKDRLQEYRSRIAPLPAEYRIGPDLPLLEMEEAQPYAAQERA